MREKLKNYDKLNRNEKVNLLVEVNNNLHEYAGFLDTDRESVRNFVLDVFDNNLEIMACEQTHMAKAQTKDDLKDFYE